MHFWMVEAATNYKTTVRDTLFDSTNDGDHSEVGDFEETLNLETMDYVLHEEYEIGPPCTCYLTNDKCFNSPNQFPQCTILQ